VNSGNFYFIPIDMTNDSLTISSDKSTKPCTVPIKFNNIKNIKNFTTYELKYGNE